MAVEKAELDGRPVYKLTERALDPNQRFDERVTWIDAATFVALRTEQRRGGKVRADRASDAGSWTYRACRRPWRAPSSGRRAGEKVTMVVRKIDYETPIAPEFFSTLALIKR